MRQYFFKQMKRIKYIILLILPCSLIIPCLARQLKIYQDPEPETQFRDPIKPEIQSEVQKYFEQKVQFDFQTQFTQKIDRIAISPRRQLPPAPTTCTSTTKENYSWVSGTFAGTTKIYQKNTGNYTLSFPIHTTTTPCRLGSPDIDYSGPSGSYTAWDCGIPNAPLPSYSYSTFKWTCPGGFQMNSKQSIFWTDGYQLLINSSDSSVSLGTNLYHIIIYYYGNNSFSLVDDVYIQFTSCTSTVGALTFTPSPCFSPTYALSLFASLVIPFCSITFNNPCLYPVVFKDYKINGVANASFAWLIKNSNNYTIQPTLASQVGIYNFVTTWTITDNAGTINIVTGNFTLTIYCDVISAISNPTNNTVTYTATLSTPLVIPEPTWTQTPACGYNFTKTTYFVGGVQNFVAPWLTPSNLTVNSTNILDDGTYIFELVYSVTNSQGLTKTFNYFFTLIINGTNPCSAITYTLPTMTELHLLYMGPAVNYSWTPFQDSLSITNNITEYCGVWTYSWSPNALAIHSTDFTQTSISNLQYSFLWNSGLPTDFTLGVPYNSTIIGYLNGFQVTQANFNVYLSCTLTSITQNILMSPTAYNYSIGDPAVVWFYPTFTQTQACGYILDYQILIDGNSTQPIWFSYIANSTFSIQTNDTFFEGNYNITIITSWSALNFTNTQSVVVTFIDPCKNTSWNPNSLPNLTTSIGAFPSLVSIFTAYSTLCGNCGPIDYYLSPTQKFISVDEVLYQIKIATTNPLDFGVYIFNLTGILVNYPNFASYTLDFYVNITACVQSSISTNSISTTTPVTLVTIFAPALIVNLAKYQQIPDCGLIPAIVLDADTIPSSIYQPQPFWSYINIYVGQVYSQDYTLNGLQFTFRQTTTIGLLPSQIVTNVYQFTDPCLTTSLLNTTLPNIIGFLFANPQSVTLTQLNDTISLQYPSATSIPSCFTQSLSLSENGATIPYATLSGNIWTIQTNDSTKLGPHIINVTFTMTRYPTNFLSTSFTLRLFSLIAPDYIVNQTYQVQKPPIFFASNMFTYAPISSDMILTHKICMSDGSSVPSFLTYTINDNSINFTVLTQQLNDVGTYNFQIQANLASISGTGYFLTNFTTYTLIITPAPETNGFQVNLAPYFTAQLSTIFYVYVGDSWSYNLPQTGDFENQLVTITTNLGQASIFMTFKNGTLNIISGITTENLVNQYLIDIVLTDSQNAITTQTITFNLLPKLTKVSNNSSNQNVSLQNFTNSVIEGVNISQLFADALLKGSSNLLKSRPTPVPKITSLSKNGEVVITFDQTMVVSKLSIIQNTTVVDGKTVPIIELKIKPGYYSSISNLSFTYEIIDYTSRIIKIQINFENPILISSLDDPDKLNVKFNANNYFFSEYGKTIKENTLLEKQIPRQMTSGFLLAHLDSITSTALTTTNVLMAGNMILNIFLSASLQQLWSMVTTQQIIVLMPLFNVNLPANAGYFFGFIMSIASFDILPTDRFYNQYFEMTDSEPINESFEQFGFNSQYFLYNLGSMMIGLLSLPAIYILIVMMKPFRWASNKIHRWHNQLSRFLFWGHSISVFRESYTILVFCSLINVSNIEMGTKSDQLSTVVAIIIFSACIIIPVILSVVLFRKFPNLLRSQLRFKWGILFTELKLDSGRMIILQVMHYFFRRLILGVLIICQNHLFFQLFIIHLSFCFQLCILGYVTPFKEPFKQKMEYFNECIIMSVLYCIICFTDIVRDVYTQFQIGYICCAIVSLHFLINLFFIFLTSSSRLYLYCLKIKKQRVFRLRKKVQNDRKILKIELEQNRNERKKLVESIQQDSKNHSENQQKNQEQFTDLKLKHQIESKNLNNNAKDPQLQIQPDKIENKSSKQDHETQGHLQYSNERKNQKHKTLDLEQNQKNQLSEQVAKDQGDQLEDLISQQSIEKQISKKIDNQKPNGSLEFEQSLEDRPILKRLLQSQLREEVEKVIVQSLGDLPNQQQIEKQVKQNIDKQKFMDRQSSKIHLKIYP